MKDIKLKKILDEEILNEGFISFDHKLVVSRSKSLLTLLGDNNNTMGKSKFLTDLYKLIKKHSTLKAK